MNSRKRKLYLLALILGIIVLSVSVYKQHTYSGFFIFPPMIKGITYDGVEDTYSVPRESWDELLEILHTSELADVNIQFQKQREKGHFKFRKITIQSKRKIVFFIWGYKDSFYIVAPIKSSYIYKVDSDIQNIIPLNR